VTALALDHFRRSSVDIAVIETGLGGRLDATNVLSPVLTVTTSVDHDHTEILGSSLAEIAAEKAGILKPGVPHLIGHLPREASRVMRQHARQLGCPIHRISRNEATLRRGTGVLDFCGKHTVVKGVSPSLAGEHQLHNAALALKAVDILAESGFRLCPDDVRRGIEITDWPGRFQVIRTAGQPTVILDVCHNASGAAAFTRTFRGRFRGQKTDVIVGLVKRKEHQEIIHALAPIAKSFTPVNLHTRRSTDARELCDSLDWCGIAVRPYARLLTARRHLLKFLGPDDIISIVGSHYLVGEYLQNGT